MSQSYDVVIREASALWPGFIDVHTHDDFAAVLHPEMNFKLCGGVTTCVVGNCGMGAAPFAVRNAQPANARAGRALRRVAQRN